jgi:hypothetical protein
MPQGFWNISSQQRAAAAGIGIVLHQLVYSLDRQQLLFRSRGWLCWPPRLRPLHLRCSSGLNPKLSQDGGWEECHKLSLIISFASQLGGTGGELDSVLDVLLPKSMNFLLLSQDRLLGNRSVSHVALRPGSGD